MGLKSIVSATCVYLTVISINANAVLVERLGGLAYYDTDADLTWLADASYLRTLFVSSGGIEGDDNGRTSWAFADNSVSQLNVAGVTGWRLPKTVDIGSDGCNYSFSGTDCGYNVDPSTGELANLFANVLGRVSYKDTDGNVWADWSQVPPNFGPFSNISPGYYWSNTEGAPVTTQVLVFSTSTSDQIYASKTGSNLRTWAVHSGDVGKTVIDSGTFSAEPSALSTNQSENLTYIFCFKNDSRQDATVEIVSDIPIGTSFVTASGSYSTTPSTVIWSFGLVPVDQPRQCVDMVVNVLAVAGSTLVANTMIQSDQIFIPDQVKTTIDVVAPTPTSAPAPTPAPAATPASDEGGGIFGLLELFALLLALISRRSKVTKFSNLVKKVYGRY